uniref:CSON005988 protein n=1 Tax=Culicoides sonorensis TaxID=179676 RepID=A0A336LVL5_CULSO
MMSLMASCDKSESTQTEEPIVLAKRIQPLNSSGVDTVDGDSIPRPLFENFQGQSSEDKLQFNAKKAIVAGMLDITLLSSNANQLKYITAHDFNAMNISITVLISLSLFLQVCSGLMMIYKHSVAYQDGSRPSSRGIEVTLVAFVFLITVINVVASVFTPNIVTSPLRRLDD